MPEMHIVVSEATRRELRRLSEIYEEPMSRILEIAFWMNHEQLIKYLEELKKKKEEKLGRRIGIQIQTKEKKRSKIDEIALDYENPKYEIYWEIIQD